MTETHMEKTDQLNLYVWEDVLENYTFGVIFAFAHSVEEARSLIATKESWNQKCYEEEMAKPPQVITQPYLRCEWGSD